MIFQSSAVKGNEDTIHWLICRDGWRDGGGGVKTDGRTMTRCLWQISAVRTEQDLSRERSTCCCWCRRHGDFCPDGGLDYQPAKPCLLTVLRVCYSVPMGSWCQNSAVVPGLMGGLLMQIARGCREGKKLCWNMGMCMFGKRTCEKMS